MCGFVGYCSLEKKPIALSPALVEQLSKLIAHRGPDGQGSWFSVDKDVGMIHRRLAIVDQSKRGAQPMVDEQAQLVIVFNGEIYNHLALRAQLEKKGYQFHSSSDTETVLKAYQEWGMAFLDRLQGMFAFVLFDQKRDHIFAVRDRIGIKPLYFCLSNGIFSFASEIKAFWPLPWIEKKINAQSISHYLTHLAVPAPQTIFEGVYKLPAGFYLQIDDKRELSVTSWYNPALAITQNNDTADDPETLEELLMQSVQSHKPAELATGVLLSGGLDSSLLTAMLCRLGEQPTTFQISFQGDGYRDRYWARAVAKRLQTNHYDCVISEFDAFSYFKSITHHNDEPLADAVSIPLYFVTQLAKTKGIKVLMMGEGADELFFGYQSYIRQLQRYHRWQKLQRYAHPMLQQALFFCARRLGRIDSLNDALLDRWKMGKPPLLPAAVLFAEKGKINLLKPIEARIDPIVELFYPAMSTIADSFGLFDYHHEKLIAQKDSTDYAQSVLHLELKHRLPELLLMRTDKMTMAASVEARVPFLSEKLVSYALSLPLSSKYQQNTGKYLLKKVAEKYLAPDIIYRPKVGFNSPVEYWFSNGHYFKKDLMNLLEAQPAKWHDLLDFQGIKQLLHDHDAEKGNYSYQLWAIYNLLAYEG